MLNNKSVKILEPLKAQTLKDHHPAKGNITVPSDRAKIEELMTMLKQRMEVGYATLDGFRRAVPLLLVSYLYGSKTL